MLDIGGSDAKKNYTYIITKKNIFTFTKNPSSKLEKKCSKIEKSTITITIISNVYSIFSSICVGLCRQSNFFPKKR